MSNVIKRIYTFILKENTRNFVAFIYFITFVIWAMEINVPSALGIIGYILHIIAMIVGGTVYLTEWLDKTFEKNHGKVRQNLWRELKKIFKEIVMFIPVLLLSMWISDLFVGQPLNQIRIEESFRESPVFDSILCIIIGPMLEEFIFRFLPYRFIKNKVLYVVISTVIFATMHVIGDPNALYYVWLYMIRSSYYAYRYHKTHDIWVSISMHSFNNLIATLPMIISYF